MGVRLLVTWGLYSAIPLVGIAALMLGNHFRWLIPGGATIMTPVLILAGVGIVAGLRGMTLAARSVADPLRQVTDGMAHVGVGRYGVRAPVYDSSEIGYLQIGFNDMVAGWSNGSSCETFSVAMLAATWRSMRYSKARTSPDACVKPAWCSSVSRASRLLASAITVSASGHDEAAYWQTGEDVLLRGRYQPTTLAEPTGIA